MNVFSTIIAAAYLLCAVAYLFIGEWWFTIGFGVIAVVWFALARYQHNTKTGNY
jgi:hypothetical protein